MTLGSPVAALLEGAGAAAALRRPSCHSAWNKDPVFEVIGIPGIRVHTGLLIF
jgi:hypothetical protein